MIVLLLTSANVVSGTNNSVYRLYFSGNSVKFYKGDQIALQNIIIPYSWFNINSSLYNNNTFSYTWFNGVTYTVTLANSYLSVSDINSALQYAFISNGHYLVNSSGQNVYYGQLIYNTSQYAVQWNSYPIPSTLPSGWTNPASLTLPSNSSVPSTPILNISSTNNFGTIIGFSAGSYPSVAQTTNYSVISTLTPVGSPVNTVIMYCNLVRNPFSTPQNLLYSFTPNTSFGENISISPPQFAYVDIIEGTYSYVEIRFTDQNLNTLQINDNNLSIQLIIDRKNSLSTETK